MAHSDVNDLHITGSVDARNNGTKENCLGSMDSLAEGVTIDTDTPASVSEAQAA